MAPGMGSQVAISPSESIIPYTAMPENVKPSSRLRGPDLAKDDPIPRKRLVPIVPPIAWSEISE